MTAADGQLNWHKMAAPARGAWRSWAVSLDPTSTMPPYYLIATIRRGRPERVVSLIWCRSSSTGPKMVDLGEADDFITAKSLAQSDYDERLAQQRASI